MHCQIVEYTNGFNWGKFIVGQPDEKEWARLSLLPDPSSGFTPLLQQIGQGPNDLWILDLQTCEGAMFRPDGNAKADLDKHQIWVCPMYEVFLGWLYSHPEHWDDVRTIPSLIEDTSPECMASSGMRGYRRGQGEGGTPGAAVSSHERRESTALAGFSARAPVAKDQKATTVATTLRVSQAKLIAHFVQQTNVRQVLRMIAERHEQTDWEIRARGQGELAKSLLEEMAKHEPLLSLEELLSQVPINSES